MNKKQITELARKLRKDQTGAEYMLWQYLRNRRLIGVKFFRQHPIIYDNTSDRLHFFIPDFYSAEKKLVIELDGKIHDFQKEYDQNREKILNELGLKVIRFKNEELKNLNKLLNTIKKHL